MATFVLVHGAGDVGWYWHLLEAELRKRGHDVVAPDLPIQDDSAGLEEYADAVVDAIGDRRDLVVVAQSFGAFTAPLVCQRVPVDLLVLLAGMVPRPGEPPDDWWANTGYAQARRERDEREGRPADDIALFYHDVPPDLAAEAMRRSRGGSATPGKRPWPLPAWPDVPTRFLLCRDDRLFPAEFMRRVVRERLGIRPDEIDGGHCVALSRPRELADRLEAYLAERTEPGSRVAAGRPERYERFVALIMAPFVEALLHAAEVGPGDAVLDVACGTGFTARAAAARVGPTGRVVGADIDPGMLRLAAARSVAEGYAIGWHQASADDLPFREAEFDAVVCQQGLQFFPDPRAAMSEAARVTRKGGLLGATVWSPMERSPYFQAMFRAVERIVGAQASPLFDDMFGCSPELATATFRAAGLGEVHVREVVADIRLPSILEFVPGHLTASRWGAAVTDARPDGVELVTASMVELLASRTAPDGSVTVPFASLLITGRR